MLYPFCLACLAAAVAAPAAAEEWRVVTIDDEDPDMGRSIAFVDLSSLVRAGDNVRFRMDVRMERPAGAGVRGTIAAGCTSRDYQPLQGVFYNGDRPISPPTDEPAANAEPGTNMYLVIEGVCAGRYLTGPVDPVAYSRSAFARK